jgi:2EXR family
LIPLHADHSQLSAQELEAAKTADDLRTALGLSWKKKGVSCPLPSIRVMVVQRTPLQQFTLFQRLPMEIQLSIWDFARFPHPRVLTMITSNYRESGPETYNYRPQALMHACRNSRRAVWKESPSLG